jgi:hypothetical protein
MRYGYIGRRLLGGYSTGIIDNEDDNLIINSETIGGKYSGNNQRA